MLIDGKTLARIQRGEVTVAFRRWKRPTVRSGGTLRTSVGILEIDRVEVVGPETLSGQDARAAGFDTLEALMNWLNSTRPGTLYRIELRYRGRDPLERLRENARLSSRDLEELTMRFRRMDTRWKGEPGCTELLRGIQRNPGLRAAELAAVFGMESDRLKRRVRWLKELGLTESLKPGYRLSPRGEALLLRIDSMGQQAERA